MKIVILDGYTANPGDLSWEELKKLGEVTVYDRTKPSETVARAAEAEIVLTNKVIIGSTISWADSHRMWYDILVKMER